jgi:hypothetical protein
MSGPSNVSNLPPANPPVPSTNLRGSAGSAAPGIGGSTSTVIAASSSQLGIFPSLTNTGGTSGTSASSNSHLPPLVSGESKVPESPRKVRSTPNDVELTANNYDAPLSMRISRTAKRIMIRLPHAFIAIASVFVVINYVAGKESLAYSAATFVGVAGTVYCVVRAVFLEVLPEWMMPLEKTREWRHLMNATYTAFITVIFTSAVWKLPDLSAAQGLVLFMVAFGIPYRWLSKYYDENVYVDKQPTWDPTKYRVAGK